MTPIFELSSKLFPSSDVRGCENRRNHVLRSGPILPFADKTTTRQRKVDGWMDGWEEGGKFSLPLFLLFVLLFSLPPLKDRASSETLTNTPAVLPHQSAQRTDQPNNGRARRCLTHSRDHLASLPTRYLSLTLEDWTDPVVAAASSAQMQKGLSLQNCFELGSVNLRKYAKPIWNFLD